MSLTLRISQTRKTGGFRRFFGLFAVVMLVAQLAFPGLSNAAAGGDWIEICSEFGIVEVQIDDVSHAEQGDCPDCGTCVLCAADTSVTRKGLEPLTGLVLAAQKEMLQLATDVRPNPAQFWHEGRGPPRENKNTMACAFGASVATTLIKGEAP